MNAKPESNNDVIVAAGGAGGIGAALGAAETGGRFPLPSTKARRSFENSRTSPSRTLFSGFSSAYLVPSTHGWSWVASTLARVSPFAPLRWRVPVNKMPPEATRPGNSPRNCT